MRMLYVALFRRFIPSAGTKGILYYAYVLPRIASVFFFFHPFHPILSLFSLQNLLRRFVTFSEILSIFCLLKTFLSYQQVINNSHFSTQFFENLSAD